MARRSESRVKLACTLPSKQAIMKFASYWRADARCCSKEEDREGEYTINA